MRKVLKELTKKQRQEVEQHRNFNIKRDSYNIPVVPLFENIVTVREEEDKYTGTIFIPETAKVKPMGAQVVAIGPDVKHVKVGDFILVGRYAGAECIFREVHYTIIRESEVLGIVPDGGK